MAFSMQQIKVNVNNKGARVNPKAIFGWIQDCNNISYNAKQLLNTYISKRLSVGGLNNLNLESYKYLIKDLLKNCCGREFLDIVPNDTEMYLGDIAFQLKWALERHIFNKKTLMNKSIYMTDEKYKIYEKTNQKPPKKLLQEKITDKDLQEYMSNVRWL